MLIGTITRRFRNFRMKAGHQDDVNGRICATSPLGGTAKTFILSATGALFRLYLPPQKAATCASLLFCYA